MKWSNITHVGGFIFIEKTWNNSSNCITGAWYVGRCTNNSEILASHFEFVYSNEKLFSKCASLEKFDLNRRIGCILSTCVPTCVMNHAAISCIQAGQICQFIVPNLKKHEILGDHWLWLNWWFFYHFCSACGWFKAFCWSIGNGISEIVMNI